MRLRGRLLTLVAVGVLVPAGVKAQSSVIMKGTVSETVTLSVSPSSIRDVNMSVVSSGGHCANNVVGRLVLSLRLFVCLCWFVQIAVSKSPHCSSQKTAVLSQLSVTDVRATGRLVSPQIS